MKPTRKKPARNVTIDDDLHAWAIAHAKKKNYGGFSEYVRRLIAMEKNGELVLQREEVLPRKLRRKDRGP